MTLHECDENLATKKMQNHIFDFFLYHKLSLNIPLLNFYGKKKPQNVRNLSWKEIEQLVSHNNYLDTVKLLQIKVPKFIRFFSLKFTGGSMH